MGFLKHRIVDAGAFWELICGSDHQRYKFGYSKTMMVCNPAFCFVLKIVGPYYVRQEGEHECHPQRLASPMMYAKVKEG